MVIAVTHFEGDVFPHFGRSPEIALYLIGENNNIVKKQIAPVEGPGHEGIAYMLMDCDVDVLLCGGIGMGAINALASVGIEVYPGCEGNVDDVVNSFLNGKIEHIDGPTCSCHDNEHEEHEGCGCHNHENEEHEGCGCHNHESRH